MKTRTPFTNHAVADVFDAYPKMVRQKMFALRALIFATAQRLDAVGTIEETLKWGEPAYLTSQTKSGTTIRIDWKANHPTYCCIYFNCKTTLVHTIRDIYEDTFCYEGNRCILFPINQPIPKQALADCFAMALTYHLNKKEIS